MTTTPQRFTKCPVTIEAMQYDEHDPTPTIEWIRDNDGSAWLEMRIATASRPAVISIETLEGKMTAQPGDWIIRGIKGEFYPCKPEIFGATYQPAAERPGVENADTSGVSAEPSDAEIQAAARAVFETRDDPYDDTEWGELTSADRERWECYARAALVAARRVAD